MTIARFTGILPVIRERIERLSQPEPVEPAARTDGDLLWALRSVKERRDDIYLIDAYYRGDHRIAFTATDKWKTQFGRLIRALNANYCPRVVNALVDRLRLGEVVVSRDGEPDKASTDLLTAAFRDNRFDRRAGQMHALAARHGEAYLLVWPHPDHGRPAYYPHTADRMVVRWDTERPGELALAAKVWMEDRRCRVTLYYPDRVERWVTRTSNYNGIPVNDKGFLPYDDDDDGPVYANPYGRVPVVAFLNDTIDGMTGRSELVDVIPQQDLLNKALADMFVAMEFAGWPQRWATGLISDEKDPVTGMDLPAAFIAGVERIFTSDSSDTTFGQFQAADLTQFVAVQDSTRSDIARVSGTPLHYLLLSGDWPSGEALHVADAPMRAKVVDRQDDFGTSWEDVALLTVLVAERAGPDSIGQYTAEAAWRDTAPKGDVPRAEYAQAVKDLGASEAESWRSLGWDAAKIEAVRAEREEEGGGAFDAGDGEGGGEAAVAAVAAPRATTIRYDDGRPAITIEEGTPTP